MDRGLDGKDALGIIGNTCWSLFKKFLQNRRFTIRIDGFKSEDLKTVVGLPQRSVLSPVLCNVFLFLIKKNYKYADNLTILTFGSNASSALDDMQNNIDLRKNSLNNWRLPGSVEKTKAMFPKKKTSFSEPNQFILKLGQDEVDFEVSVKALRVHIDDKWIFSQFFLMEPSAASIWKHKRTSLKINSMNPKTFKLLC